MGWTVLVFPVKVFLMHSKGPFLGKMPLHTSSFLEENDRSDSLMAMFRKVWSNLVLNI